MKSKHTFLVMPADLNSSHGTLFGGKMMLEMDYAAAFVANRFLYSMGPVGDIVTASASQQFKQPVYQGELVTITGWVEKAEGRSIFVQLIADTEVIQGNKRGEVHHKVATAAFHMMTIDEDGKSTPHGKKWPKKP